MDMQQLKQLEQAATLAANLYVRALTAIVTDPTTLAQLKRQSDATATEYRRAWREYQVQAAAK
jgi:hypothetical protein